MSSISYSSISTNSQLLYTQLLNRVKIYETLASCMTISYVSSFEFRFGNELVWWFIKNRLYILFM